MQTDGAAFDRIDAAILEELAQDGRMSATELSRRIGLSKSPTQTRLKRLEQAGVITGYRAVLDRVRMGLAHVAFVEVKLSDTREAALQAFAKSSHKASLDAINAEPVLKKHEATLKAICEDFAANGTY